MPYIVQSLQAAEQEQTDSQQLSEQELAARRETESILRNQIAQLQKDIEERVHSFVNLGMQYCHHNTIYTSIYSTAAECF